MDKNPADRLPAPPLGLPPVATSHQEIGRQLALRLILILAGVIAVLVLYLLILDLRGTPTERVCQMLAGQADNSKLLECLKTAQDERKTYQTFWFQDAQLLLVNVLLPLLTGLFGYIFGTERGPRSNGRDDDGKPDNGS